jgi:hypothetical protein
MIMSNLLLSPCLAEQCKGCDRGCWSSLHPLYLTPQVLQVNRNLYQAGIAVLYGKNQITMDCDLPAYRKPDYRILGPHTPVVMADFQLVKQLPMMHPSEWIRELKVHQQFARKGATGPCEKSVALFKQIQHLRLRSLHVYITPDGRTWDGRDYTLQEMTLTLSPLRLLRGIRHVKITQGWFRYSDWDGRMDTPELLAAIEAEKSRIIELVQGDSEVEEIEEVDKPPVDNRPW